MKWMAISFGLILVMIFLMHPRVSLRRPGNRTVADRLHAYGDRVDARLAPRFAAAGVAYPPKSITLLALKEEQRMELYAHPVGAPPVLIHRYPILAASGGPGPKLREGDRQVPEGLYEVESLNPNSRYHLSLRLNYPNAFDRARAREDQRDQLGGDIMIHGSDVSIGCLAMGDQAAEDLFVLTARVGISKVRVILAPCDMREKKGPPSGPGCPAWVPSLYDQIKERMMVLPSGKAAL
jgi:hypothetical protein